MNGTSLYNNIIIDTNNLIFPTCLELAFDTIDIDSIGFKNYNNNFRENGYILWKMDSILMTYKPSNFKIEKFYLVPDCIAASDYEIKHKDNCFTTEEIFFIKKYCNIKNDYRKIILIANLNIIVDIDPEVQRRRFPAIEFVIKK